MAEGNKGNELMLTWFLLIGLIGGAIWGMWYLFQEPILSGVRWLRVGQLWVIGLFTDQYDTFRMVLGSAIADRTLPDSAPLKLTPEMVWIASRRVGDYVAVIAAVIMAYGFYYAMYLAPAVRYRRKLSLDGLIKVLAKTFPVITPIIEFNPIKQTRSLGEPLPRQLPLFAEALAPEEWLSFNSIRVTNHVADKEQLRRALAVQLGPRWRGLAGQPDYIRALIAAFALKAAQKRKESDDLLGAIALCWHHERGFALSLSVKAEIDQLLADPKIGGEALKVMGRHGWRTSALLGLLAYARDMGGVLAPPSFLWLRGQDRALWYPLNNLGRRTYHAEAAGAMSHFMAEQTARRPLLVPRMETAIATINQYLATLRPTIPPRADEEAA